MRRFEVARIVAALTVFGVTAITLAEDVIPVTQIEQSVEGRHRPKPDRHPNEPDIPAPEPQPRPEPIPPKPHVIPEPDAQFHVHPLPQPEHHVKPDHETKPALPLFENWLGWITPSHYVPSIYDVILFLVLIIVCVSLVRRTERS